MIFIGIDPGASGGIATQMNRVTDAIAMPDTDTGIIDHFKSIQEISITTNTPVVVLIEKVTGFIGFRKKIINIVCPHCLKLVPYEEKQSDPASRMFNFGDGYGYIRGVCRTLNFRWETPIPPKSWQLAYGLKKNYGMSQTKWKNILKDKAKALFPNLKVTLKTADALIILDFLTRIRDRASDPKPEF